MRIPPRPVLPRDRSSSPTSLIVWLEIPEEIGQSASNAVNGPGLEVRGMKARRVAGVVDHRTANPTPAVILPQFDRVGTPDHAVLRPVQGMRARLVGDPVLIGVPERASLDDDHSPPLTGQDVGRAPSHRRLPRQCTDPPRQSRSSAPSVVLPGHVSAMDVEQVA